MISGSNQEQKADVLSDAVEGVFRDLLGSLPVGSASMEQRADNRSRIFKLAPVRSNAAPLSVIVPRRHPTGVTLIAGRGSFFEIPQRGGRYTSLSFSEELRTICMAVIHGHLEEWVLLDGDEVLAGRGTIALPTALTVRWRQLSLRLLKRNVKRHYDYEPWFDDKEAVSRS
jgi:hypothetical protein